MSEPVLSFAGIWNSALDVNPKREYVAREHIWASELGRGYYDRYHKMKGRKPTTPPNLRSRRKFEGGYLTEWVVMQVLARAGVLRSAQVRVEYKSPAIDMKVTGKADFLIGGKVKDLTNKDLKNLPETFGIVAKIVVERLQKKYPNGIPVMNIEVKSVSGMVFERYAKAPGLNHALQAFHYALGKGRPTLLVYVSRDDFRIAEWVIRPKSPHWCKLYDEDITGMSEFIKLKRKDVPKEPLLKWDGEQFSKNWEIEYSNYLTDYKFDRPELYAKPAQSCALRLSNIVKKIREGKPIDGKVNLKTLEECYAFYPGAEEIILRLKEKHNG